MNPAQQSGCACSLELPEKLPTRPFFGRTISARVGCLWYNKGVDLLTLNVTAREADGQPYTLVAIAGEADVTNREDLRGVLDDEVTRQPSTLILDLSGLRFMDSSALHVILQANRALDRQGGVMALVAPQEAVAKMLRLTTADRLIPVFRTLAEAAAG
jgi:anti-sigma B factor antagonist